jgi:hypothetical protein
MSVGGRFSIVENPVQPGQCRVCGVQFGVRPLIDTSLDAEFCGRPHTEGEFEYTLSLVGAVYLCSDCVGTMADLLGWIHPKRAAEYLDKRIKAENLVEDLEQRILGLEAIVNGYQSVSINSDFSSSNSDPDSHEDSGTEAESNIFASTTGDSIPTNEVRRTGSGKPTINESISNKDDSGLSRSNSGERTDGDTTPSLSL